MDGRMVRGKLRELGADLLQRQPDVLGEDDEGEACRLGRCWSPPEPRTAPRARMRSARPCCWSAPGVL